MKLKNYPLKRQFLITFGILSTLILAFVIVFVNVLSLYQEKERFISESKLEAKMIADTVLSPLAFFDVNGATESLHAVKNKPAILHVAVYDQDHHLFADFNPNKLGDVEGFEQRAKFKNDVWLSNEAQYISVLPITLEDEILGHLYILKSAKSIVAFSKNLMIPLAIFSITLILLVILISRKLANYTLAPIISLSESAKTVADNRDFSLRVSYNGKNEIARLYDTFNMMLIETQDLTDDLEKRVTERTLELQNSLDTLQEAQKQLVESEKMAALGSLVSGVAHEVNTPLGNAVTGSSIISRESEAIRKSLDDGSLKRSEMENKLGVIIQSSKLLYKSITQAAELIKNFKRISIDQSTNDLRDFDLKEYIEEIIQTFHNKLKHVPAEVEVIAPENLVIYSYPGVYAQLLNNLISNAILHAFESVNTSAKITITIELLDESLHFIFSDNGKGLDASVEDRVFEPFVTTKRNSGGTGLGMNIVYNLITQKLGGTIQIKSEIDKGTTFDIHVPYIEKVIKEID